MISYRNVEGNMETFYVSMTTIRELDRWSVFMATMLKNKTIELNRTRKFLS